MTRLSCAQKIYDAIYQCIDELPKFQKGHIKQLASLVHRVPPPGELLYKATHQNKCLYYSLLVSDQQKVASHFKLELVRQVELWAMLVHINGMEKHHQFCNHLLSLRKLPKDVLPQEFIRYCNAKLGGSVFSIGDAKRHRPHWMRPYLKAEMLYGLRVLLSIVQDSNAGNLSKAEILKRLGEVKFAGDLVGNHLLAVGVLLGLLVDQELLTNPVIATTLCKKVHQVLFDNNQEMSNDRIRKGTEMASKKLGLHLIAGKHALCESVRDSVGNDAYHRTQDFVWISDARTKNNKTLMEIRSGNEEVLHRTERDDLDAFLSMKLTDEHKVKHKWWIPPPNRSACLIHFVKECMALNDNPMEVLHSSHLGTAKSNKNEQASLWKKYLTMAKDKIEMDKLPEDLRLDVKAKTTSKRHSFKDTVVVEKKRKAGKSSEHSPPRKQRKKLLEE